MDAYAHNGIVYNMAWMDCSYSQQHGRLLECAGEEEGQPQEVLGTTPPFLQTQEQTKRNNTPSSIYTFLIKPCFQMPFPVRLGEWICWREEQAWDGARTPKEGQLAVPW